MVIPRGEDRPLLVSMLDGTCSQKGSDEEAYIDAKLGKPFSVRQKWKVGKIRGRAKTMALGAASIINKWPEHLTICWLFAMAFCMVFVTSILMLIGASRKLNAHPITAQALQKRCISNQVKNPLQLPEKTRIHLHVIINEGESFNPYKYKNAIIGGLKKHPNHAINIYVLLNDTSEQIFKRNSRFRNWEQSQKSLDRYTFFDTPSAESVNTVTPIPLISENGINEQRVIVVRSTFSDYFHHSPLSSSWKSITPHAFPIVFRVLTLWEHGGITMPWRMFLDKTDNHNHDRSIDSHLRGVVKEIGKNHTGDEFKGMEKHLAPHQLLDDFHEVVNLGGLTIETGLYASPESPLVVGDDNNNTEQIQRPQTDRNYIRKDVKNKKGKDIITTTIAYEEFHGSGSGDGSSGDYSESSTSSYSEVSYSDHLPKSIESHEPTKLSLRPNKPDDFVAQEIDRFVKKGSKKNMMVQEHKIESRKQLEKLKNQPQKRKHPQEPNDQPEELKKQQQETNNQPNELIKQSRKHKKQPQKSKEQLKPLLKDQNKKRIKRSPSPEFEEVKPHVLNVLSTETYDHNIDNINVHVSGEHLNLQLKKFHNPFEDATEYHNKSNEVVGRKLRLPLHLQKDILNSKLSSSSEDDSSSYSDSSSDSSDTLETIKGIFRPVSDVIKKQKVKRFHEDKGHRLYEPFEHMNIFAMPGKTSVTLDQFGYYFATKKPCHAYLGHLIALLQSLGNLEKFQEIIPNSLRTFCGQEKLWNCKGIMLV